MKQINVKNLNRHNKQKENRLFCIISAASKQVVLLYAATALKASLQMRLQFYQRPPLWSLLVITR